MSESARNSKASESAEINVRQFELRRNPDGTTTTFRSGSNSNFFEPVPGKTYQAGQTVSFLTNREPDSDTVKRKPIKSRDDKGQLLKAPEILNAQSGAANTQTEILPGSSRAKKRFKKTRFTKRSLFGSLLLLCLLFFGLLAGQIYFAKQLAQSHKALDQRINSLERSLQDNYRDLNGTKLSFEQQLSQIKQEREAEKKQQEESNKPKANSSNLKTLFKRPAASKKASKPVSKRQEKQSLKFSKANKANPIKAQVNKKQVEEKIIKASDEAQISKKKSLEQAEESFERALNSLKKTQPESKEASLAPASDKPPKNIKAFSETKTKRCFKTKLEECEAKF